VVGLLYEEAVAMTVSEYVRSHPHQGFKVRPKYFRDGDYATFYISDRRACAQRVDELLTVYRDIETGELTGCKLKGVRRLLAEAGDFGVVVCSGRVQLGLLFLTAACLTSSKEAEEQYKKLAKQARGLELEVPDFSTAA
jgi:hypothetical protein